MLRFITRQLILVTDVAYGRNYNVLRHNVYCVSFLSPDYTCSGLLRLVVMAV